MTVEQLCLFLQKLVADGKGDYEVCYDCYCAGLADDTGNIDISDEGKAISLS